MQETKEEVKQAPDQLKIIGDLYEEAKDCLNGLGILEEDRNDWSRCYEINREMRDIAATQWKQIKELTFEVSSFKESYDNQCRRIDELNEKISILEKMLINSL